MPSSEADGLRPKESTPTTKWHWIVCFAVPVATIIEAIVPHSFGTFVAHFQKLYHLPVAELIWITAITSAAPCILLPVFVPLIRHYPKYHRHFGFLAFIGIATSSLVSSTVPQVHWMFLTYTPFYGVCSSVLLAVCIVILSEYFPVAHPYHILATSLYQIGYPVAAAAFSPFVAFLISKYNWSRALQIIGLIQMTCGCCTTLLFKPYSSERVVLKDGEPLTETADDSHQHEDRKVTAKSSEKSHRQEICSRESCNTRPQFLPWFLAKYLNYACWFALRSTLTPFLRWRGNSLTASAFIMTAYAIGEITLAVVGALLSRFLRGRLLLIHFIGTLGMAIFVFLWTILPQNYSLELAVAVFIGIFVQVTLNFGYPASAEVLGLEMGVAWTVTNVFAGLGILSSPILGGVFFDQTASFLGFFYAAGGLWLLQAILHAVSWTIIKYRRPPSLYEEIR